MSRLFRAAALAGAAFCFSSATAHAQSYDVWALEAQGQVCELTFQQREVLAGIFEATPLSPGCNMEPGEQIGFSMNASGTQLTLYSVFGQNATAIARLDQEVDGTFVGIFGDGIPTRMYSVGQRSASVNPAPQAGGADCLRYRDSGRCADAWDIGAPAMPGSLQTVANMNVRFLPNTTSNIIDNLPQGACVDTSGCREAPFNGGLWCEIRAGNFTGWILKQDDAFVYSRNGCG